MGTIKARGHLSQIGVRIPGEKVSGQILKFECGAEGLEPGEYRKAEQVQRTGKLTVELGGGKGKPAPLELAGKLLVRDFPPATSDQNGERHMIFRPGSPVPASDLGKLLGNLPSNDEERESMALNLTFREEQGELGFKDGEDKE